MQNQLVGSFGRTIAFVIPGMISLYALAFFAPELHVWFGLTQPPTIAGFLFVVLGSIGLGVFVSGIRWLLFDWFLMPKVNIDNGNRINKDTEAAYQALIANHYQFYQFYMNSAVSIILLFLAWALTKRPDWLMVSIGGSITMFTIVLSGLFAKNAIELYYNKATQLLGTTPRGIS